MTDVVEHHSPHLEDGDLVRHLDGASDHAEQALVEQHLHDCAVCRNRLSVIRRNASGLSALLQAMDYEPSADFTLRSARLYRPASWQRTWMRVAALIVLGVGLATTVRPVRAWLADRWHDIRVLVERNERAPVSHPGSTALDTPASPGTITFVPTTDVFLIQVTTRQEQGSMTVRAAEVDRVSASIEGPTRDENLVVLPTGLRIQNGRASGANYRLTVPRTLALLLVEIDGAIVMRRPLRGQDDTVEIDLASRPLP